MKRILIILFTLTLYCISDSYAQRTCGFEIVKKGLIANDPKWAEKYDAQRASLQGIADKYIQNQKKGTAYKTTAASAIPVIFHVLVTSGQLAQIGGMDGLAERIDSQITVLNRDFNRANLDANLIPSSWVPLWGNAGIQFGLAHTNPAGHRTLGYEVTIIPNSPGGFGGSGNGYRKVKHDSSGGQDSWDVTRYLNIWVTSFTDFGGLLGLTVSMSQTGGTGYPVEEIGICMNYAALGKRVSATDHYIATGYMSDYYDQGRSLTHEMGHFFEIWHTWGDDGGGCPWSGGSDDGIADTPPEGNSKFYAYPYSIPGGTNLDSCHKNGATEVQPIGVASLDFMNYTDDVAMQLFTPDQAAVMASTVAPGGVHYSLTQNPTLLDWGPISGVADINAASTLRIAPNPASEFINISFDGQADELKHVVIIDMMGREIISLNTTSINNSYQHIDLRGLQGGIYFVRCTFVSGSVTRKIWIQ